MTMTNSIDVSPGKTREGDIILGHIRYVLASYGVESDMVVRELTQYCLNEKNSAKEEGRREVIEEIKKAHYISVDFEGHAEELKGETVLAWKDGTAIRRLWSNSQITTITNQQPE